MCVDAHRLVSLQEIVAELMHSSTARHAELGSFVVVGSTGGAAQAGAGAGAGASAGAGAGSNASSSGSSSSTGGPPRKRQRISMKVSLSKERVVELLGEDALHRTPLRMDMTLEEPLGARVFTRMQSAGAGAGTGAGPGSSSRTSSMAGVGPAGFALSGVSVASGVMKPDLSDPAYNAYVAWRRAQDKATAASTKRVSTLARAEDVTASQARARADALALLAAGGPMAKHTASVVAVPRARSVLEAFEKAPVWSLRQLMESTGQPEPPVRADVQAYCDFQRAGPHAGKYTLKAQYRTAATPPVPASV